VRIAAKNIRERFLRSIITTAALFLAVSFFSFVRVNLDVANGLLAGNKPALRQALAAQGYEPGPQGGRAGQSPTQRWLIAISLLVCVTGILNARLMSVTERFREIGTMKCLGAADRVILRLFLLEAAMEGLFGAAAGAAAGGVLALAWGAASFGAAAVACLSWKDFFVSLGLATALGCGLSLAGVLYPAIYAARMQPVAAMRTEQ
jgi:hypothetical protein